MRVCLEAFAKLNLALRVVRRRDDGFHDIDSLVQTIDLRDRITVELADSAVEVLNDAEIEGPDITERAARAIIAAKGLARGFRIAVEKRIPMGAGLGGGSSDAAAVLRAIDKLTPPELNGNALRAIAADIGSDVPLFLAGGLLRMTGRGEELESVPVSGPRHFLVVVPPVHCATGAVYEAWDATDRTTDANMCRGQNDLLHSALSVYPELAPYRDAVGGLDAAYWGMSGSGSSFYAAFEEREAALLAADRGLAAAPAARLFVCRATDTGHQNVGGES